MRTASQQGTPPIAHRGLNLTRNNKAGKEAYRWELVAGSPPG